MSDELGRVGVDGLSRGGMSKLIGCLLLAIIIAAVNLFVYSPLFEIYSAYRLRVIEGLLLLLVFVYLIYLLGGSGIALVKKAFYINVFVIMAIMMLSPPFFGRIESFDIGCQGCVGELIVSDVSLWLILLMTVCFFYGIYIVWAQAMDKSFMVNITILSYVLLSMNSVIVLVGSGPYFDYANSVVEYAGYILNVRYVTSFLAISIIALDAIVEVRRVGVSVGKKVFNYDIPKNTLPSYLHVFIEVISVLSVLIQTAANVVVGVVVMVYRVMYLFLSAVIKRISSIVSNHKIFFELIGFTVKFISFSFFLYVLRGDVAPYLHDYLRRGLDFGSLSADDFLWFAKWFSISAASILLFTSVFFWEDIYIKTQGIMDRVIVIISIYIIAIGFSGWMMYVLYYIGAFGLNGGNPFGIYSCVFTVSFVAIAFFAVIKPLAVLVRGWFNESV